MSAILAVCGIVPPKRDELLALAKQATEPGWWQDHGDRLPPELRTLSDHEDAAIAITSFQTSNVPGLLETAAHMRALMRVSPVIPTDEIDERVRLRQLRQRLFDRRPSGRFRFFMDENVLRRTGPGRETMSDQVHHLLRISVRKNIEIRVIPDAAGFHAGRQPFHLMEFTELHPVVHIEDVTSVQFLERKDTIAGYRRIAAELDRVVLNEGHSRAWLASLATSWVCCERITMPPPPTWRKSSFHRPE